MKTTKKLILSLFMIGMVVAPVDMQAFDRDMLAPALVTTGIVGVVAAIAYTCIDSNATLLYKADGYLSNLDTCQDLLPPATWHGTTESYFEQYIQRKFSVRVTDMQKGSGCNYKIVNNYVSQMKSNLYPARQCVEFRSTFYTVMSDKLSEIKSLDNLLTRAMSDANYYDEFLLAHQILNFHASLPMNNAAWAVIGSPQEQQASLIKWIRRGYYSNVSYPVICYQEQLAKDLKFIRQYLGRCSVYSYPILHAKLVSLQDPLETAYDMVLDSSAYQIEKDMKHKDDLLLAEQEKARAQQAAAYAQQQAAYAQQQQAWAQQNQAWAQHRNASAQEEANRIAKKNNKK